MLAEPITEWYPIPGYPKYKVSPSNRVIGPYKERKVAVDKDGYLWVICHISGKRPKNIRLNRALCEAFHGPPPSDKPLALHRDGNKQNNTRANLYWGSNQENMDDMTASGHYGTGERHWNNKLTEEQALNVKIRAQRGENMQILAKEFGISCQAVGYIKRGQTWKFLQVPSLKEEFLAACRAHS